MKKLYNGKTQKEWIEQLSESLYNATFFLNDGKILNKTKNINIYFDKDGNILSDYAVKTLKESKREYGYISDVIKRLFNVDDDWEQNYISIDSECICQLLFFMNREDILSTIKDMMNCLCK